MPFLAYRERGGDTNLVVPEEIDDGETVFCPECSGRMRPRGGGKHRARHFMHVDSLNEGGGVGCEGIAAESGVGESELHRKWKSLAVSALRTRFQDFDIAQCGLEETVDVSDGPSLYNERRADVLLRFADPITNRNRFFGVGVVVEVQYQNENKDFAAVTADYLRAGYSIYWAHESDFTESQFQIERFDHAFNERWPNAFSPYFIEADEALVNVDGVEFDPREIRDGWTFVDPRPECGHSFHFAYGELFLYELWH